MKNILKTTRYKTFYISPRKIKYCLSASDYCDYTQWNSSKIHPHAEQNRGVFREDPLGYIKINNSKWDYNPGIIIR